MLIQHRQALVPDGLIVPDAAQTDRDDLRQIHPPGRIGIERGKQQDQIHLQQCRQQMGV